MRNVDLLEVVRDIMASKGPAITDAGSVKTFNAALDAVVDAVIAADKKIDDYIDNDGSGDNSDEDLEEED